MDEKTKGYYKRNLRENGETIKYIGSTLKSFDLKGHMYVTLWKIILSFLHFIFNFICCEELNLNILK